MSKAPSDFKETNVKRATCGAIRGVLAAGIHPRCIKVDKFGNVSVVLGKAADEPAEEVPANDLDTWLAKHADKA